MQLAADSCERLRVRSRRLVRDPFLLEGFSASAQSLLRTPLRSTQVHFCSARCKATTATEHHLNKNEPGTNLRYPNSQHLLNIIRVKTDRVPICGIEPLAFHKNQRPTAHAPLICGISSCATSNFSPTKICVNLRPYLRQSA